MPTKRLHLVALALLASASCAHEKSPAKTPPPVGAPAGAPPGLVDEAALDRAANPCDDFFQFACGGWIASTAIPADRPAWSRSFSEINERNQTLLREILDKGARGESKDAPYAAKLGDYWSECMDEAKVETASLATLQQRLAQLDRISDGKSLAVAVADLHLEGVGSLFDFGSQQDFKDATREIGVADQGGLGLPDRDYYVKTDPKSVVILEHYREHVARMLELLGETHPDAATHAERVVAIETALARVSLPRVDRRNPDNIYHRIERPGLKEKAPRFDWDAYFDRIGTPSVTEINVAVPAFFEGLAGAASPSTATAKKAPEKKTAPRTSPTAKPSRSAAPGGATKTTAVTTGAEAAATPSASVLVSTSLPDLKTYLRWHLVHSAAPALGARFVDEDFRFRSQNLTGEEKNLPRWKRCVTATDRALGEALAQPFVKLTFGAEGKSRMLAMVHDIEESFRADVGTLTWMDGATKAQALDKLGRLVNKIGYPDKWRNYDALAVDRTSFLANVLKANAFESRRQLDKIGKPVDRAEWEMTPPTVNAYYEPSRNEMVFPAGILQPPFFNRAAGDPTNYGGIGMVIGHELTHGFDDEGRRFDGLGNLREWWSPEVGKAFEQKAECVAKQYSGYVAVDDLHLNGHLTLGENIADLGGLKIALAALESAEARRAPTAKSGGFDPRQQFFLGYAQSWCTKRRESYSKMLVTVDPHSPPRYRVNGVVSNLPEFAAAFSCQPTAEGAPRMAPADRCVVW